MRPLRAGSHRVGGARLSRSQTYGRLRILAARDCHLDQGSWRGVVLNFSRVVVALVAASTWSLLHYTGLPVILYQVPSMMALNNGAWNQAHDERSSTEILRRSNQWAQAKRALRLWRVAPTGAGVREPALQPTLLLIVGCRETSFYPLPRTSRELSQDAASLWQALHRTSVQKTSVPWPHARRALMTVDSAGRGTMLNRTI